MIRLQGSTFTIGFAPRVVRLAAIMLACGLAPSSARADDSVINSKHDLSAFGPGPVRAIDETRVCIFCHVPHNASPAAPLWNRYNPTTHYRIYRSPTVDARIDQPGPASKQCLSCHDGSIALGMTLHREATNPILMNQMYMPSGPSNLTNDLSDDHPIGFRYDRALSNVDRQLRPPQLIDHRIALGERNEVECTACHDPHNNELGNFLRITERQGALCITCHDLKGWRLGAHANSPKSTPRTVTQFESLPYRSMVDNACASCHVSHSAPVRDKLLYDRPSRQCLGCHDGVTGANIAGVLNGRSAHRISPVVARPGEPEQRRIPSHFVECTDCHNPHAAQRNLLSGAPQLQPNVLTPPAMRGVPGVSATGAQVSEARFYYEVCFRCHSDRPVRTDRRIIRQRETLGNVRRQFVPSAASAHPVIIDSSNASENPSLLPRARRAGGLISCQDCHNNPDAVDGGPGPSGPHASRFDGILARRYETADFTAESAQAYALCYDCHDRTSILNDESFTFHRVHVVESQSPCSACHDPHGVDGDPTRHSHLINFDLSIVQAERLFVDQGRFAGSCTLTCHGVRHVNFTYGP